MASSSNASQSASPPGLIQIVLSCFFAPPSSYVFLAYNLSYLLLLLPLCSVVLHRGLRLWRKSRSSSSSSSSSAPSVSHSDCITYHLMAMETLGVAGSALLALSLWAWQRDLTDVGFVLTSVAWYGQTLFHCLTCVERHLAVVRPLTYRRLRSRRGVRLRNAALAATWASSLAVAALLGLPDSVLVINLFFFVSCLMLVSFCSVSVLRALIRPGPGEQEGGARKKADQSKRRAFCTVTTVLGVLLLRFLGNLMWFLALVLDRGLNCEVMASALWLNLPGNLVLPLLFLHRRR